MSVRQKAAQAWTEEKKLRLAAQKAQRERQIQEEAEKDAAALERVSGCPLFQWFGHDWVVVNRNDRDNVILRTIDDDQEAPVWFAVRPGAHNSWEMKLLDPRNVPAPGQRLLGARLVHSAAEVGEYLEELDRQPLPAAASPKPPRPPAGESGVSKSPDGRR